MKKLLSFLLIIGMLSVNIVFAETIDITTTQLTELNDLINTCKGKGINPEYEIASYNVLNWYVTNDFMAKDEAKMLDCETNHKKCGAGCTNSRCELRDIIAFNREKLYEIYTDTKTSLEAYIAGTATPKSAGQAYDFSSTSVDGGILRDKNGKAIFSVGYASNKSTNWDVAELTGMGATNVVEERGITNAYTTNVAKNWMTWTYGTGGNCTYSRSSNGIKVTKSGSAGTFYLEQEVAVDPSTKYELSFTLKGNNVGAAKIAVYDAKTRGFMWQKDIAAGSITNTSSEFTTTFNTVVNSKGTNFVSVGFEISSTATELYIVSARLGKYGTTENILSNSTFTTAANSNINIINLRKITGQLQKAKDTNTMLSLIISPHIFPTISGYENDSTLYTDETNEFIKFNINHPKAREVVEDYLRAIGKMIEEDENASYLSNIILTNESAFDVSNFKSFYLPEFREYLKTAYSNDISKLNQNWGTSYSSFNSINVLNTWCDTGGYSDYDAIRFNDKVFTEWHSWMAGILKEYIPEVKINAKPMKYFDIETVPYWELAKGTDIEKFDTFSDISGCDAYSFRRSNDINADTFAQKMMWYDFIYSLTGKPVNNSEDHIIREYDNTYSDRMSRIVFADLWQGALHGRAISSIWNFSTHDYNNLYDSDLTNNYLFATRPDCLNEIAKASLDLRKNSGIIEKFNNQKADVAIFYSKSSQMHTTLNGTSYDTSANNPGTEYLKQLFYAYKGATTTGQKVGFVTEDNPAKMNDYKVVIVPSAQHTTQKAFNALQTFVNNGGKVIVANDSLGYYEYHRKPSSSRVLSGAINISAASAADYASAVRSNIDSHVEVKEASTGNYATDIDFSYFEEDGKLYISLLNLNETEKQYKIYCDGQEITRGKDLISGEKKTGSITLSSYEPVLLRCSPIETSEVINIYSNDDGKITWEADDEDCYSGAIIYSVSSNNIVRLAKETGFSYTGEANKTYEIVSANGQKRVRVTTGNKNNTPPTFTLTDVQTDRDGIIKINVKNNLGTVAHGVVTMTETTAGGDIVKISSVEMSLFGKADRNIEFNVKNNADTVTIKVYNTSDKKKVLSNTITK